MTNAGLTAALAPVRKLLDELDEESCSHPTVIFDHGKSDAAERIRSALDRIHPEPDVLAALGMVALGMLKELREQHEIEGESCKERVVDFCERADELLAAAYPIEKAANPAKG